MKKLLSLIITVFVASNFILAATPNNGKYGVGFQFTAPQYGLSGMYNHSDDVSLQVILGGSGSSSNLGGRFIYRFKKEEYYNMYGYGAVSMYANENEILPGFGAGAGVEINWKAISSDLPPIFINWEIGMSQDHYEHFHQTSSFITMGMGLHYYFE